MIKQACPEVVTNKGGYSLKKALVSSTMAACVATAGFAYISPMNVKAVKNKTNNSVSSEKDRQMVRFIKKTPLTYTEPKPYAKAFVISEVYKEANPVKKNTVINESYFSDKISDVSMPKTKNEQVFDFSSDFKYVSEAPPKYNYSSDDVVKDYDTSTFNINRELYDF